MTRLKALFTSRPLHYVLRLHCELCRGLKEPHEMETEDLTTIGDSVPKVFDARGHAVMDYLTAGSFLALAYAFRNRHERASMFALVNGASILMLSMLTDYPGGVFRTLSFKTHRSVDIVLAGLTAAGPAMLGFAGDPEAQAFHGQAMIEGGVIAATNWEAA